MPATTVTEERAWWAAPISSVVSSLGSDATRGLTDVEAEARFSSAGPNVLAETAPPSWVAVLTRQFASAVTVVLLVAGAIAAAVGDAKDTAVILVVVVLGAAVGFVQERRAERAISALRRMTAPFARVVRHGEAHVVPAPEIVVGDLIELEAGDIVPADARLLRAPNLRVSEAALTGESIPVEKSVEPLREGEGHVLADRRNMVFKGTAVAYGRGAAIVTATGMDTALGAVASLLHAHQAPATPMQRRLARLGRQISITIVMVCGVVFMIGLGRGEETSEMLLSSVSLAVAAIPEALPAVVTISLALGAQRMARHRAVIRKLTAVETLGSVTVIAADKTGTITAGEMVVERVWLPPEHDALELHVTGQGYVPDGELVVVHGDIGVDGERLSHLLHAVVLCNDARLVAPDQPGGRWSAAGDPTEAALLTLAGKALLNDEQVRRSAPRIAEEPFDSARRRMTTFHQDPDGQVTAISKGAVEALTSDPSALEQAAHYAQQGYRVLAFASRQLADLDTAETASLDELELLGLVAMADPPRREVAQAIADATAAGIRCVMVTGDHPDTARAIADRVGMLAGRSVMTGEDVDALSPAQLARAVDDVAVFARIGPEQKLAIVEAFQQAGHVVAMTGDGVNDAPALRTADIGVAMGLAGTEVAKEAGDMVLADDNFATIVVAAHEGRRVYDNIRRFVRYGLTGGSAEIWVMLLAPVIGLPLPLLPAQILWINLLTHGVPGLALGVEPADPESLRRPPRPTSESFLGRGLWQHVLVFGLLTAAVTLAVGRVAYDLRLPWQTMLLSTLAMLQLGNAFAVRSETLSTFALRFRTNRALLVAVVVTVAIQLAAIYTAPMQELLDTEALDLGALVLVAAGSTATFWAIELEKWLRRRGCHALTR